MCPLTLVATIRVTTEQDKPSGMLWDGELCPSFPQTSSQSLVCETCASYSSRAHGRAGSARGTQIKFVQLLLMCQFVSTEWAVVALILYGILAAKETLLWPGCTLAVFISGSVNEC